MLQTRAAECSSWREACVLGHGWCSIWQLADLESFRYYDTASVLTSSIEELTTSSLLSPSIWLCKSLRWHSVERSEGHFELIDLRQIISNACRTRRRNKAIGLLLLLCSIQAVIKPIAATLGSIKVSFAKAEQAPNAPKPLCYALMP